MAIKIGVTKFDNFDDGDTETLKHARIEALNVLARLPFPSGHFVMAQVCPMLAEFDEYIKRCTAEMYPAYAAGCRYFEIHYYPNTQHAGLGWAWASGVDFGRWWVNTVKTLRDRYPEAKFGFPKLEVGDTLGTYRANSTIFQRQADIAIRECDFISMGVSFKCGRDDNTNMLEAAWNVRSTVLLYNKPTHVTFYNTNNNIGKRTKGEQYLEFYHEMALTPNVVAAYSHTLSSSDERDSWATWRSAQKESPIPGIIASRTF